MPAIETRVTTAKEIGPAQVNPLVVAPPALASARPNFWGLLPTQDMPDANVQSGSPKSPVFVPGFANSDENLSDSQVANFNSLITSLPNRVALGTIPYTPVVTANTGSFTTLGAVSGKYAQFGKLVFLNVQFSIVTVGTGTDPIVTMPLAAAYVQQLFWREDQTLGTVGAAQTNFGTNNQMILVRYDNANPATNNTTFVVTGWYETV